MTIKLFACGDIFIKDHTDSIVSEDLGDIIRSTDLAVCNFEGPLESKGGPIPKVGPHISQHTEALHIIKKTGFTHCAMANNHMYDYGETGLAVTLDGAREHSLEIVGAGRTWDDAYALKVYDVKGCRIGLLAYCEAEFGCLLEDEGRGGYAYINHGSVNRHVADAREAVDILLVIVHAGAEEVPVPLPEWRARYRELCDLGVDIIIAHHPHVPQGWETYGGKLIFYSLGNFYFDVKDVTGTDAYAYSVLFEIAGKKVEGFTLIPHKRTDGPTAVIDEEEFNERLNELCEMLGHGYDARANEQALMLYESRYKPYYIRALMGMDRNWSFLRKCKHMIDQLLYNDRHEARGELLLLHNIRIDSHRYATQRALSLLREKQ